MGFCAIANLFSKQQNADKQMLQFHEQNFRGAKLVPSIDETKPPCVCNDLCFWATNSQIQSTGVCLFFQMALCATCPKLWQPQLEMWLVKRKKAKGAVCCQLSSWELQKRNGVVSTKSSFARSPVLAFCNSNERQSKAILQGCTTALCSSDVSNSVALRFMLWSKQQLFPVVFVSTTLVVPRHM